MFRAITHAYRVLDWYSDLTSEELPPVWMWPYEDELETWFDRVLAARKSKYSSSGSSDDDETPGMVQNDYAKGRGRDS